MQEYDIDIKPAKIVKGQGFYRLLTGASNLPADEDSSNIVYISKVSLNDSESQYVVLIFYLKNGYAPPELNHKRKRVVRLKANQYEIIGDVLFRRNYDSVLLRFLEKSGIF